MSQRQIPHLSGTFMPGGSGYSKLSVPKPKTRIHNIVSQFSCLGSIGINKPKDTHTELKQGYHQATQQAHARFLAHSFTHTETLAQQQQWIDWAIWMCASSSALPLLSKDAMAIYLVSIILIGASRNKPWRCWQSFITLTLSDDDTTAAQRLFGNPFRICLTGCPQHGELPRPRRTARISKAHRTSCPVLLLPYRTLFFLLLTAPLEKHIHREFWHLNDWVQFNSKKSQTKFAVFLERST